MNRLRYALLTLVSVVIVLALSGCQALGLAGAYNPEKEGSNLAPGVLGKTGTLRVGVNAQNAPFSTQVQNKFAGIDIDVASALADDLGVQVEFVDTGSDAQSALDEGKVDVIMNVDTADTSAKCWISDAYIQTSIALFAADDSKKLPTADTTDLKIEAQSASMSAWEVSNQFGEDALETTADLKTAFTDMAENSVSYVAADAVIGSYVTHTSDSTAKIIGLLQKPSGYGVGVANTNDSLKEAVSASLEKLNKNGVLGVIQTKWLGAALDLSKVSLTENASSASSSKDAKTEQASMKISHSENAGEVGANAVRLEDLSSSSAVSANLAMDDSSAYSYNYGSGTDYTGQNNYTYTEPSYTTPQNTYPSEITYDTTNTGAALGNTSVDTSAQGGIGVAASGGAGTTTLGSAAAGV